MKRRFFGLLRGSGNTGTDFGHYLMNLQSGQTEHGYCVRCTGSPSHDEARRDYAAMERRRAEPWTHADLM